MNSAIGKVKNRDEMLARVWKWLPWLSFFLALLPAPIILTVLFLMTTAPDSAAVLLALAIAALGLSGVIAGALLVTLLILRRRWFQRWRDRLSSDGITASEVQWFLPELTTAERKTLREIEAQNPLLADAYCETLASRLTASRLLSRLRNDRLRVEKQLNRLNSLAGTDTTSLRAELEADHNRLQGLTTDAGARLADAKARLQMIEASAGRNRSLEETELMAMRLAESGNHLPLSLEMSKLEKELPVETQPPNLTNNDR